MCPTAAGLLCFFYYWFLWSTSLYLSHFGLLFQFDLSNFMQKSKYALLLTGTPALSRPIELYKQVYLLGTKFIERQCFFYVCMDILNTNRLRTLFAVRGIATCGLQECAWIWKTILHGGMCFDTILAWICRILFFRIHGFFGSHINFQ